MPTKALLRPGELLDEARRTPGVRAAVTGEIDLDDALARRDAFTSNWDDEGQVRWLESVGVDLIRATPESPATDSSKSIRRRALRPCTRLRRRS